MDYRQLFETMSEGFALHEIITDPQGRPVDYRFIEVNPAFERLTGLKRSNLIGKTVLEVLPATEPYWIANYGRVALTGEPVHINNYSVELGRWFDVLAYRTEPGQFAVVFTDVTNRKETEDALRESERRITETLESIRDGFFSVDADWCITYINRRAAENVGVRPEDVVGKNLWEKIPRISGTAHEKNYRKAMTERTFVEFEMAGVITDRFYEIRVYPAPNGLSVYWIDITDRKQAEEALRQANETLEEKVQHRTAALTKAGAKFKAERQRLFDVLETLPAYVVLLGADYRVPFANRYFEERFGKSNGKRCFEYLFDRTEPCEDCETFKVLKKNAPHHWQWTGPDGRDYDIHDFPFIDSDGSLLIMEMGIDITDRNRAEQALRERSRQLRTLASELTLAEQRERRRLAEALHDNLQQLLVGAKLMVARIGRSTDDDARNAALEVQKLLDEAIACTRSLTHELCPTLLHSGRLFDGLEWLAEWMHGKHGLSVSLEAEDDKAPEPEDIKVLLFQSVRELLFNTVKHAGVNVAKVRLRSACNQVEIIVSDEGVGFDPQAVMPRAGKQGGYGLFSVRERLERLGGSVEIDSSPGHGSRFKLVAPLCQPSGTPETPVRE